MAKTTAITKSDKARSYAQSLISSKVDGTKGSIVQFEAVSPEDMEKLFQDYEMEPPIADVGEGQVIKGTLLREGSPVETASQGKDPKTGEVIPGSVISTWVIQLPDSEVKFRITAGHQLNQWMPSHKGHEIVLVKGRKIETGRGGRRVREWLTGCATCKSAQTELDEAKEQG